MKYLFATFLIICANAHCHAQGNVKIILSKLDELTDQYKNKFSSTNIQDRFILIYVPGNDDPLQKIYDKLKNRSVSSTIPITLVGGFGELAAEHGAGGMSSGHLISGFTSRYGNSFIPVWLDLKSEIGKALGVKGFSVAILSKKTGKVIGLNDYGSDRKRFFEDINQYIKPVK